MFLRISIEVLKGSFMFLRMISVFVCLLLLTGCPTMPTVQKYEAIDTSNKTMTVPFGSQGLIGKIKDLLSKKGWKLSVYQGPDVTEGQMGEKTKLKSYNTFNTRYTLLIRQNLYDHCLNFEGAYVYDISMVDNKTGSEVLTMSGRSCEFQVVKGFEESFN